MNNLLFTLPVQAAGCHFHENLPRFKVTHDYFTRWTVFFLLEGEFSYSVEGGGEHTLRAGEMLICPPYRNVDKVASAPISFVIAFWEGGKELGDATLGELSFKMNARMMEDLRLLRDLPARSPYAMHLQADLWYQICALYHDPVIHVKGTRKPSAFLALLDDIEASLGQDLTLDVLSARSGYSKSALIRYFQENTHTTPMQYVAERRINLAKRRLSDTRLTVREIAEACGFKNEFYFSTVFRRRTGMSPSDFRRRERHD